MCKLDNFSKLFHCNNRKLIFRYRQSQGTLLLLLRHHTICHLTFPLLNQYSFLHQNNHPNKLTLLARHQLDLDIFSF